MHKTLLEARVAAKNRANKYANELYPLLRAVFEPYVGKSVHKVGGQLLAKVKAKIDELNLPNPWCGGGVSVQHCSYGWSISFTVKATEKWGDKCVTEDAGVYVCHLDGQYGPIKSFYEPTDERTSYEVEEVLVRRAKYERLQKAADYAKSELAPFGEYDRC